MFEKRYKSHHDVKDIINKLTKKSIVTPFAFNKLLNEEPENKEAGIYVHTPYCDKICSFCNMNRKQVSDNLEDYVNYLCKEFKKYGSKKYVQGKEITAIFFGGGTPTIYKPNQLEKILSTMVQNFNISPNCEFTFETTLHNLTLEKLSIMEKYGVNRLSIGIQTFSNRGRKLLNRTYEQEKIIERIRELQEDFKGLICIDIIYNYLDESLEEIENDAEIVWKLGVDSVSFYSLMIHEGSNLSKALNENKLNFNYQLYRDKELHHTFLNKTLNNGYKLLEHTKITNGKDEYRYIKNINSFSDLFAIGVGAGGRVKNIEYFNLNKFITFYAKDSDFKYRVKKLSGILQYPEVKLSNIRKLTGDKIYPEILRLLQEFQKSKYIEFFEDSFKYTLDGIFWGNSIVAVLVEKMIELE